MSNSRTSAADVAATGIRFEQLRASYFEGLGMANHADDARAAASLWRSRYQDAVDFHSKEDLMVLERVEHQLACQQGDQFP